MSQEHTKKTLFLKASRAQDLAQAAQMLKEDKSVALPTETVYGLAARLSSKKAFEKLFVIKNRPNSNPLILHVANIHDASPLFNLDNTKAKSRLKLLQTFWPGPLTIVCQKSPHIPSWVSCNLDTIAVRCPKHPTTQKIIELVGEPLFMPSANLSTRPSPTKAEHVLNTLDKKIDAVVDSGSTDFGIESTVIRIDQEQVILCRLGSISQKALEECLQEQVVVKLKGENGTYSSPGQHFIHYSPKVKFVKQIALEDLHLMSKKDCTVLIRKEDFDNFCENSPTKTPQISALIMPNDALEYSRKFYDFCYEAEKSPEKPVYFVIPAQKGHLWDAVREKITKACTA